MPNGDAAQRLGELISAPLEQLLVALGSGIGRSQAELDRHTIQTQALIDEHPVLSQYGIEATWYQIPTTELELKIAIAMEQPPEEARPQVLAPAAGQPLLALGLPERLAGIPRLWAQPVNARFVNQFGFNLQAASTVKVSIAAVPPPAAAGTGVPTSGEDDIRRVAREYLLPKEDTSQDPSGRVTVNFNPGQRAWYVIQTEEIEGAVQLRVLVKIDDESRPQKILKLTEAS